MARKKRHISTKRTRRVEKDVTSNPFEIRINRKKQDILGRKTKSERGMPGVARSRALKKRQKTLLHEYKNRNKANNFIDKRFGEYNPNLTPEEKMLQRFQAEKQKKHERSGVFNLEEEELTHFGQSLSGMTKFEDMHASDEGEEDEDIGNHFGGFLKKREVSKEKEEHPKSRKEIMEEIVAKSKQRKHERQVEKDLADELRDKLDREWQDVRSLLRMRYPGTLEERTKADDYDIAVREMAFEVKAQASNRLKTEEEIAQEEEGRLRKLEAERLRRMKGVSDHDNKPKHVSADDLGDSFTPKVDDRYLVRYKDGKMVLPEGYEEDCEEDEGSGMDDEEEEDNEENVEEDETVEDEAVDKEGEEEMEEGDTDDTFSDLDSEKEESLVQEHNAEEVYDRDQCDSSSGHIKEGASQEKFEDEGQESNKKGKNLPYTFEAPKSYTEFLNLVGVWSYDKHLTIVERIHACNHPKLAPANKKKMEKFFEILSQYFIQLCDESPPPMKLLDGLARPMFDIAQHSPVHSCQYTQHILKSLHKEFKEQSSRGGKKNFPCLKQLLYLRLISLLFPTSDLQHGVCTPAMLFLAQVLCECPVKSMQDVAAGLFSCHILLQFVSLSKRFIPEVVNFLYGAVFMASKKEKKFGLPLLPFKHTEKSKDLLVLQDKWDDRTTVSKLNLTLLLKYCPADPLETDERRIQLFRLNVHLLAKFAALYKTQPSYAEIFKPVLHQMKKVEVTSYPQNVQEQVKESMDLFADCDKVPRKHLTLLARKAQAIATFEPKFFEHYEVISKRNRGSKALNEKAKLKYKYKKEFKGAVREIRKDSHFLASQQLKEQREKDAERQARVKEIERLLAGEQAEVNEMNRKKRKKR